MSARLWVWVGGVCQESGGESFAWPAQEENWFGMVPLKPGLFNSMVGRLSMVLPRLHAVWIAVRPKMSPACSKRRKALRDVIPATSRARLSEFYSSPKLDAPLRCGFIATKVGHRAKHDPLLSDASDVDWDRFIVPGTC